MLKLKKINLVAVIALSLIFIGCASPGQPRAAADVGGSGFSKQDLDKISKECAKALKIQVDTKKKSEKTALGACDEGYIAGLEGNGTAGACNTYKKDKDASKACTSTGYNLGKKNTANILVKKSKVSGAASCFGSNCASTPTGQGKNCDPDETKCDLIALYVNPFINVLSVIVGLVIAASLILGGVQYSAAGSDTQKVSAAKSRISNTLLALIAYGFMYAFLNFLVPGGIF